MNDLSGKNFGLLIAYVLPSFVILLGVSFVSPTALDWLKSAGAATGPSVGGFLYAFLFSIGGGVTVSAVRWLLLDTAHRWTGIKRPPLKLQNLEEKFRSFERVVEYYYRYYEFYGGMAIATCFSYLIWRLHMPAGEFHLYDVFFFFIEVVFVAASRDALRNYYGRAGQVLGTEDEVPHDKRCRPSRRSPNRNNPEKKGGNDSGDID